MNVPGWFRKVLSTPFEDRFTVRDHHRLHYLLWRSPGDLSRPGIILVHGSGAHAHWWDFIAPFLLEHHHVAAIDLAGMGDSDHLEHYDIEAMASDLLAVADDAGFHEDTVIIGHSFGGYITLKAGLQYSERLAGIVLVDSPIRPPDYQWERDSKRSPIRTKRIYPDAESALARFRLMPPQDCKNSYILEYIARHSIAEVENGWSWKFDDRIFLKMRTDEYENRGKELAKLSCRLAVVYGEDSYLFSQDIADYMFDVLDHSVPFIALPEAQHHVFLDQPLAFVSVIRSLLGEWRHSKPQRGFSAGKIWSSTEGETK